MPPSIKVRTRRRILGSGGPCVPVIAGLVALALLLPPRPAAAQPPAFGFERIAQEHGLSNGTVTAIVQGPSGFLWIGTEDGLNRYDGSGFAVYHARPDDSTSLGHSWVTSVLVDRSGSLWVGTLGGGLNLMVPRHGFRHFRHSTDDPRSPSSDRILAIHQTSDGMLWLATARGLDRLDPRTGLVERHGIADGGPSEGATDILALTEDRAGRLWLGTHTGLLVFDRARRRFEQVDVGLRTSAVRALAMDRQGMIWVGTEHQLASIDPARRKLLVLYQPSTAGRPSPFGGRVMSLHVQQGGTIWVGSDDGLTALDPTSRTFLRHRQDRTDPLSLGGTIVRSVLLDRGGVLWAGLESYGLGKHAPSAVRFETIRDYPASPTSLSSGYVRGLSESRDGGIWIATQFGGLNRLDRRTREVTSYRHRTGDPRSLPTDNVWAAVEDRDGTLWVGTQGGGLGTLDPRSGVFTRSGLVPADLNVATILEDAAGALLVGTEGGGLFEISRDRRGAVSYGASRGDSRVLASNDVQAVLEDSRGMLWVGGAYGLTRLDRRTGSVTHFRGAPGLPGRLQSDFVTNVVEDRRGTIWVATKGGGLSRFDRGSGSFTTVGIEQGLPHSFVYGILEDAHGNLWLSSDDGIARFDPRTGHVTRYGLSDGIQAREFNRRAFLRAADGTMFLGGVNGLTTFRPDLVSAPPPPPPVSLLTLRPAGESSRLILGFTEDSVITLEHQKNAFAVSFRALDFTAPGKVTYSHRLEGVDRGWINSGNRGEATYAGVPPGRYVLRVLAAGADGVWSQNGAAMTLVVRPPWWGTWWARLLALLAAAALIAGVVQLRVAAARRRSARLEERVDEQTRELIGAQTRLHEALAREREAARELFDITAAVPGAVFRMRETTDGRREFPFVSEGVRRLWPDRGDEPAAPHRLDDDADRGLLAERLMALARPADATEMDRSLMVSRDTLQPWHVEWQLTAGDDETSWLSLQARASRESDGSTVWTGVVTDVTAARDAEATRAALEAKMLQAQQAESLGVLAGGIAHDFNNLLVGVLGNAELLRDELPPDSDEAQTVGHIRSAALRAADLTRQLLAYAGRGRFVVEPVDLAELVSEMMALVRSAVPRTIAFEFHQECDESPVIDVDATQIRQVVMNLVTNASEAIGIGTGRVSVTVRLERRARSDLVLLHFAPDMPESGPYVVLEVADDGVGLDEACLGRIFDPFYTTKFTGRGLGLAALLGVVRAHHGALNVVTAPGDGARFLVYLPLASDADRRLPATPTEPLAAPGTCARVLVVDDEPDVRHLTERMLRRLGYVVVSAGDGASALAAIGSDGAIDLVLMDVTMPAMDGPTTARALRDRGIGIPIVLMSGYAEDELVARGVLADASGFLQKPFAESELAAALDGATAAATS
ncbi:MAG: hybrid sensor histidine kinase/response regulator [Gemmatimonadaceae bacterium]